jgi:hypothetical protein
VGLARAHRDAVGAGRLCAYRRAVVLRQVPGVICEGMSFAHLVEGMRWRPQAPGRDEPCVADRPYCHRRLPGTDRITAQFAQVAKHYGVEIWVCPARRPQRKGVVESAINYITSSWWRSAPVGSPGQAQADLDRWAMLSRPVEKSPPFAG